MKMKKRLIILNNICKRFVKQLGKVASNLLHKLQVAVFKYNHTKISGPFPLFYVWLTSLYCYVSYYIGVYRTIQPRRKSLQSEVYKYYL